MHNKITPTAIELWEIDLYSLQMIADFFSVSKQAVRKYLINNGINTSAGGIRYIACDQCGDMFDKPRSQIRHNRHNFCNAGCYYKAIHDPAREINRQQQIKAREEVDQQYPLKITDVVYFRDHDQNNSELSNLIVFANHADKKRWVRVGEESGVKIIWP